MKKIMILMLVLMLAVVAALPVQARTHTFAVAWSLSLPTGNTYDFNRNLCWRGINVDYLHYYRPTLAWGVNVGYSIFVQNDDQTLYGENFAITSDRWTYINAVPIYLNAQKIWGEKRTGQIFAGMNAGTAWIEQKETVGLYSTKRSQWMLALAPEVGYNFSWDIWLDYASLRYNYFFEAGEMPAQSWLELRLGFRFD